MLNKVEQIALNEWVVLTLNNRIFSITRKFMTTKQQNNKNNLKSITYPQDL